MLEREPALGEPDALHLVVHVADGPELDRAKLVPLRGLAFQQRRERAHDALGIARERLRSAAQGHRVPVEVPPLAPFEEHRAHRLVAGDHVGLGHPPEVEPPQVAVADLQTQSGRADRILPRAVQLSEYKGAVGEPELEQGALPEVTEAAHGDQPEHAPDEQQVEREDTSHEPRRGEAEPRAASLPARAGERGPAHVTVPRSGGAGARAPARPPC